MRLTEYIDYLNNGRKNVKRYTHYNPDYRSQKSEEFKRLKKNIMKTNDD